MKKIIIILILYFVSTISISAETKRIVSGNINAKITIIAYESLTCSHCADFHKDVYPQLKKEYIDTGIVKIEFRHFPLDIAAFNASKISQCNQGHLDSRVGTWDKRTASGELPLRHAQSLVGPAQRAVGSLVLPTIRCSSSKDRRPHRMESQRKAPCFQQDRLHHGNFSVQTVWL